MQFIQLSFSLFTDKLVLYWGNRASFFPESYVQPWHFEFQYYQNTMAVVYREKQLIMIKCHPALGLLLKHIKCDPLARMHLQLAGRSHLLFQSLVYWMKMRSLECTLVYFSLGARPGGKLTYACVLYQWDRQNIFTDVRTCTYNTHSAFPVLNMT